MALPADIHDQLSRMEQRLRLVPPDETPPAEEVREQVQRWQEHMRVAAETIRWADDMIAVVGAVPGAPERDHVLALVRSSRTQAFNLMQRLNPGQAWFWTEDWQAGEREADADIAAGRTTFHATTEDFLAALDARRASHAHP